MKIVLAKNVDKYDKTVYSILKQIYWLVNVHNVNKSTRGHKNHYMKVLQQDIIFTLYIFQLHLIFNE